MSLLEAVKKSIQAGDGRSLETRVLEFIGKVKQEYFTFGGNCGMLAIAVARMFPGEKGLEVAFFTDAKDEEELLRGEPDVYHVAAKIGESYYDGDGKQTAEDMVKFVDEQYGKDRDVVMFTFDASGEMDKVEEAVRAQTNWDTSWEEMLAAGKVDGQMAGGVVEDLLVLSEFGNTPIENKKKALQDLQRKHHMSSGLEKAQAKQAIGVLQKEIGAMAASAARGGGLVVRYSPNITPDVGGGPINPDEAFMVLRTGEYHFPVGKDKLSFVVTKQNQVVRDDGSKYHTNMLYDLIMAQNPGRLASGDRFDQQVYSFALRLRDAFIVGGRVENNVAFVWENATPEVIKWVKKLYPGVDTIYQSVPMESEENVNEGIEVQDYHGGHTAPMKKDGAPLWDVTKNGIYPEDFYGVHGRDYASHGRRAMADLAMVQGYRNKPNRQVKIFRAVPTSVPPEKRKINQGDWVTLNRSYAVEHGRSNLGNDYKVVTKTVFARDVFTDGNSLEEWGYDPQPRVGEQDIYTPEELVARKQRKAARFAQKSGQREAALKRWLEEKAPPQRDGKVRLWVVDHEPYGDGGINVTARIFVEEEDARKALSGGKYIYQAWFPVEALEYSLVAGEVKPRHKAKIEVIGEPERKLSLLDKVVGESKSPFNPAWGWDDKPSRRDLKEAMRVGFGSNVAMKDLVVTDKGMMTPQQLREEYGVELDRMGHGLSLPENWEEYEQAREELNDLLENNVSHILRSYYLGTLSPVIMVRRPEPGDYQVKGKGDGYHRVNVIGTFGHKIRTYEISLKDGVEWEPEEGDYYDEGRAAIEEGMAWRNEWADELDSLWKKWANASAEDRPAIDKEIQARQDKIKGMQSEVERKIKAGLDHEVSKEDFVSFHKSGYIEPGSYTDASLSRFLDDSYNGPDKKGKLKLVQVLDTPKGKIEIMERVEKNQYVAHDDSGNIKYDKDNLAVMMTDEEVKKAGKPTHSHEYFAYDGEKAVGYATDSFGVPDVKVRESHQKLGIGLAMLKLWMGKRKMGQPLGQMTDEGIALAGAYHRDKVKAALAAGKKVPAEVLRDYPELKSAAGTLGEGSIWGDHLLYHSTSVENMESILKGGYFGTIEDFVSFSKSPYFSDDMRSTDVVIVVERSKLQGKLLDVEYTWEFFKRHPGIARYVTGEPDPDFDDFESYMDEEEVVATRAKFPPEAVRFVYAQSHALKDVKEILAGMDQYKHVQVTNSLSAKTFNPPPGSAIIEAALNASAFEAVDHKDIKICDAIAQWVERAPTWLMTVDLVSYFDKHKDSVKEGGKLYRFVFLTKPQIQALRSGKSVNVKEGNTTSWSRDPEKLANSLLSAWKKGTFKKQGVIFTASIEDEQVVLDITKTARKAGCDNDYSFIDEVIVRGEDRRKIDPASIVKYLAIDKAFGEDPKIVEDPAPSTQSSKHVAEGSDEEALADLRRKAHLATGNSKRILSRYADKLERELGKRASSSRNVGGVEVRYAPGVDPDSEDNYGETFVIAQGVLYAVPGYVRHDEAIMLAAREMGMEVDPMDLYAMGRPLVSGRRTGDVIWVWDNVTSEAAKEIKKYYPKVKTIWQARPFKQEASLPESTLLEGRPQGGSKEDEVVLYHGTEKKHVPKILEQGLKAGHGWGGAGTKGVYLSGSVDGAMHWAKMSWASRHGEDMEPSSISESGLCVLEVTIPGDQLHRLKADLEQAGDHQFQDGHEDDWRLSLDKIGDARFNGDIPPSWIKKARLPKKQDGGEKELVARARKLHGELAKASPRAILKALEVGKNQGKQYTDEEIGAFLRFHGLVESARQSHWPRISGHNLERDDIEAVLAARARNNGYAYLYDGQSEEEAAALGLNTKDGKSAYYTSRKQMDDRIDCVLGKLSGLPDPIPVWRSLKLIPGYHVYNPRKGQFWSFSKESAIEFGKSKGATHLVSGLAPKSSVDWGATIRNNLIFSCKDDGVEDDFPEENEINIPAHKVKNKKIVPLDKKPLAENALSERMQSLVAYHGTSSKLLPTIKKRGLKNPYLAASEELAGYYAEEAVADRGGHEVVLKVLVTDLSKLRYDGASMEEPVMADENERDAQWEKAAREHPEWVKDGSLIIPPGAWGYSWDGVGAVRYNGTIMPGEIVIGEGLDEPGPQGVKETMSRQEMEEWILDNKLRDGHGKIDYDDAREIARHSETWVLMDVMVKELEASSPGSFPARKGRKNVPIIVVKFEDGAYEVLDGKHRVSEARHAGKETIQAWVADWSLQEDVQVNACMLEQGGFLAEVHVDDMMSKGFQEFLKKYSGRMPRGLNKKDLFVRFTPSADDKIVPLTNAHSDPVAIYAYPLEFVVENPMDVSYGSHMDWVQVLKIKTKSILELQALTERQAIDLLAAAGADVALFRKMRNEFKRRPPGRMFIGRLAKPLGLAFMHAMQHRDASKPGEKLSGQEQRRRFVKIGYDAVRDNASSKAASIINTSEPQQIFFLSKDAYEVVDKFYVGSGRSMLGRGSKADVEHLARKMAGDVARLLGERKIVWQQEGTTFYRKWDNYQAWIGDDYLLLAHMKIDDQFIDADGHFRPPDHREMKVADIEAFHVKLVGPDGFAELSPGRHAKIDDIVNDLVKKYKESPDKSETIEGQRKADFDRNAEQAQRDFVSKKKAEENEKIERFMDAARYFGIRVPRSAALQMDKVISAAIRETSMWREKRPFEDHKIGSELYGFFAEKGQTGGLSIEKFHQIAEELYDHVVAFMKKHDRMASSWEWMAERFAKNENPFDESAHVGIVEVAKLAGLTFHVDPTTIDDTIIIVAKDGGKKVGHIQAIKFWGGEKVRGECEEDLRKAMQAVGLEDAKIFQVWKSHVLGKEDHEDYRGSGVGAALYAKMIEEVGKRGGILVGGACSSINTSSQDAKDLWGHSTTIRNVAHVFGQVAAWKGLSTFSDDEGKQAEAMRSMRRRMAMTPGPDFDKDEFRNWGINIAGYDPEWVDDFLAGQDRPGAKKQKTPWLVEAAKNVETVAWGDLVRELEPEEWVREEFDYDEVVVIRPLTAQKMAGLTTAHGDIPLKDAFEEFAESWQKKLVERYRKTMRGKGLQGLGDVIILDGDMVLDGQHRAMAAILEGKPCLRYVDVGDGSRGLKEGVSISSWSSFGNDKITVVVDGKPQEWEWLVDSDRAEIVDNVRSARHPGQALKILRKHARPSAKLQVKLGGLRCPACGTPVTRATAKCPNCDEMVSESKQEDVLSVAARLDGRGLTPRFWKAFNDNHSMRFNKLGRINAKEEDTVSYAGTVGEVLAPGVLGHVPGSVHGIPVYVTYRISSQAAYGKWNGKLAIFVYPGAPGWALWYLLHEVKHAIDDVSGKDVLKDADLSDNDKFKAYRAHPSERRAEAFAKRVIMKASEGEKSGLAEAVQLVKASRVAGHQAEHRGVFGWFSVYATPKLAGSLKKKFKPVAIEATRQLGKLGFRRQRRVVVVNELGKNGVNQITGIAGDNAGYADIKRHGIWVLPKQYTVEVLVHEWLHFYFEELPKSTKKKWNDFWESYVQHGVVKAMYPTTEAGVAASMDEELDRITKAKDLQGLYHITDMFEERSSYIPSHVHGQMRDTNPEEGDELREKIARVAAIAAFRMHPMAKLAEDLEGPPRSSGARDRGHKGEEVDILYNGDTWFITDEVRKKSMWRAKHLMATRSAIMVAQAVDLEALRQGMAEHIKRAPQIQEFIDILMERTRSKEGFGGTFFALKKTKPDDIKGMVNEMAEVLVEHLVKKALDEKRDQEIYKHQTAYKFTDYYQVDMDAVIQDWESLINTTDAGTGKGTNGTLLQAVAKNIDISRLAASVAKFNVSKQQDAKGKIGLPDGQGIRLAAAKKGLAARAYGAANAEELWTTTGEALAAGRHVPDEVKKAFMAIIQGRDFIVESLLASEAVSVHELGDDYVERLREDLMVLLKNVPRVKKADDILEYFNAVHKFRDRLELMAGPHSSWLGGLAVSETPLRKLLNKLNKHGQAKDFGSRYEKALYDLLGELSLHARWDARDREDSYAEFWWGEEKDKWRAGVQRKARKLWKDLKAAFNAFGINGERVRVPEQEVEEIHGHPVVIMGYDPEAPHHEKWMEGVKEGIKQAKGVIEAKFPALLPRSLPIVINFDPSLDTGGTYLHAFGGPGMPAIEVSAYQNNPKQAELVIIHEAAHHYWKRELKQEARDKWAKVHRANMSGRLSLGKLKRYWDENPGVKWLHGVMDDTSMKVDDPQLYLQLSYLVNNSQNNGFDIHQREDLERAIKDNKSWTVPKQPVTWYAGKNPEELFTESVATYLGHGKGAMPDFILAMLKEIIGGNLKEANDQGLCVESSQGFSQWFKGSKVVNNDGTPKLVYHGTNADFDEFDLAKTAQGIIWFSENREKILAGESGADASNKIISAYVRITNPAGWDEYERLTIDQLVQEGYDGIILDDDVVVFDPAQVRIVKKEDVAVESVGAFMLHPELLAEASLGVGPGSYLDRVQKHMVKVVADFRKNPGGSQSWKPAPAGRVKKIWNDYAKTGFVRDEEGMASIARTVLDNIARLYANSLLTGHALLDPKPILKGLGVKPLSKKEQERLDLEYIPDDANSDFAFYELEPLWEDLASANTAEEQLLLVDRIFNVVHERGDISAYFLEGGRSTLDQLAGKGVMESNDQSLARKAMGLYIEPGLDKELVSIIRGFRPRPSGCEDSVYALAKRLDARGHGAKARVVYGDYEGQSLPEFRGALGHVWLNVSGKVVDPTAGQFEDYPAMKPWKYVESGGGGKDVVEGMPQPAMEVAGDLAKEPCATIQETTGSQEEVPEYRKEWKSMILGFLEENKGLMDGARIFGSIAEGKAWPGDVDIMFPKGAEKQAALVVSKARYGKPCYGLVDVFVEGKDGTLLCRNDNSTGLIVARNAKGLMDSFERKSITVDEAIDSLKKATSATIKESRKVDTLKVPRLKQKYDHDCGVAVLRGVIKMMGLEFDQDELVRLVKPSEEDGMSAKRLFCMVREFDKGSKLLKNPSVDDLNAMIDEGTPVLTSMKAYGDGHWVIVTGVDSKNVHVHDPYMGDTRKVSIRELGERWKSQENEEGRVAIRLSRVVPTIKTVSEPLEEASTQFKA